MKFIKRIAGFPAFLFLAITASVFLLIKYMVNYVKYGGEAIAFKSKDEPESVRNIFDRIKRESAFSRDANKPF